jgi:hypothetical protein
MAVNTWNIVPDYDKWGKDTSWDCGDWLAWHKRLKEHFGAERAKYIWEYAYAQGSAFASHWDCRTFNTQFRDYARKEGLDTYANVTLPIIPQVLDLSGTGFEAVGDVSNTIAGITEGISSFFGGKGTSAFKVVLWVALVGSIGFLGYRGYKYIQK